MLLRWYLNFSTKISVPYHDAISERYMALPSATMASVWALFCACDAVYAKMIRSKNGFIRHEDKSNAIISLRVPGAKLPGIIPPGFARLTCGTKSHDIHQPFFHLHSF